MQTAEQRLDVAEERIDHLDALLGQFIASTGAALNRLERNMAEFKDEMKEFKNEMSDFKDWSKANISSMNTQWGNLARKMGTLVEDIFYPSSDILIEKYFKCKPSSIALRKRVRKNGGEFEADILALCNEERLAFIFEIKSNPDDEDNKKNFKNKLAVAADYLDEIKGFKLVPVYGGLSMHDSTVQSLTNYGIYAVIFKGDVLEIPNFDNIK